MPTHPIVLQLRHADTEGEVLALVSRFLDAHAPDMPNLPADCKQIGGGTAQSIAEAAVTLTTCELKMPSDHAARALVREMRDVFVVASQRITRFRDAPAHGGG